MWYGLLIFSFIGCNFLQETTNDQNLYMNTFGSDYMSNSLNPENERLRKIIQSLVDKLDDLSKEKRSTPRFKYSKLILTHSGSENATARERNQS